jgi:hypothetical protein
MPDHGSVWSLNTLRMPSGGRYRQTWQRPARKAGRPNPSGVSSDLSQSSWRARGAALGHGTSKPGGTASLVENALKGDPMTTATGFGFTLVRSRMPICSDAACCPAGQPSSGAAAMWQKRWTSAPERQRHTGWRCSMSPVSCEATSGRSKLIWQLAATGIRICIPM